MANGSKQPSFDATWEEVLWNPWGGGSNEWYKFNAGLVISRLTTRLKKYSNPHKIDVMERRIKYIKMRVLLEL